MNVVVAIIPDPQGRLLVTCRGLHTTHAGYWEFPGGKLEKDENTEEALVRELKEELGISILDYDLLGEVSHAYEDRHVHLFVYQVKTFQGQPSCLEGQLAMRWVSLMEMEQLKFPEANKKILALLHSTLVLSKLS